MIRLAEVVGELFEKCDAHFPINNSTIPLLILIKTIRYELAGEALSLKTMCSGLSSSDLCARSHIAKLEKNGWLRIEISRHDRRVRNIKSTPRLMKTFHQLANNLNENTRNLIVGECDHD